MFPDSFGVYLAARDLANQGSFQRVGNLPIGARIGGAMTGVTGHLEEKSTWLLDPNLPLSQILANRHLLKSRQMYWINRREIDPLRDFQLKFFGKNQVD